MISKINYKILSILIMSLVLSACSSSVRFADNPSSSGRARAQASVPTQERKDTKFAASSIPDYSSDDLDDADESGFASYYGLGFDGRQTASGEVFDKEKFTAAHRTLAFGTRVKVTNLRNGRSVIVIINDRGPHKQGRIIDLSEGAARKIDMITSGIVPVEIRT